MKERERKREEQRGQRPEASGFSEHPPHRVFKRTVIWLMLKDPVISGEALYYLAAAPELSAVSGRFFHLTVEEKPAAHALDRELGRRAWDLSLALAGLNQEKQG